MKENPSLWACCGIAMLLGACAAGTSGPPVPGGLPLTAYNSSPAAGVPADKLCGRYEWDWKLAQYPQVKGDGQLALTGCQGGKPTAGTASINSNSNLSNFTGKEYPVIVRGFAGNKLALETKSDAGEPLYVVLTISEDGRVTEADGVLQSTRGNFDTAIEKMAFSPT